MIKTVRLNFPFKNRAGEKEYSMREFLKQELDIAGVVESEIFIDDNLVAGNSDRTHFGNYCLVPILDNAAAAKLAQSMGGTLDLHRAVLEASDLANFKIGESVSVRFASGFGFPVNERGKIDRISDVEIVVLKKGTRSGMGWKFHVGEFVELVKV